MPEVRVEYRPGIRFYAIPEPYWFTLRRAMLSRAIFYADYATDNAIFRLLRDAVQLCVAHG